MRKIIFVPTLLLAACGQGDQTVTHRDSEGNEHLLEVEDNGETRTVTSDDGLIAAKGTLGGAQARFPDYAPQYPGAKVQSVVDMDVGRSGATKIKQHMITMQTPDAPDAVLSFYRTKIRAAGKDLNEVNSATGPMLMIGGTTPLNMEAAVSATPAGSAGTSVNVTITTKFPAN